MRGAVMSDADVVLTVGRRLDFQLAYGSPSVFQGAKFVRIGDTPSEMRDNRRGAVEILASPAETLRAMVEHAGNRESKVDRQWAAKLRGGHEERAKKLQQSMANAPKGSDGKLHPIQAEFVKADALQCGFCTPGMVMACKALLDNRKDPSLVDIKRGLSGNICRCGAYPRIFAAVQAAAKLV